MRKKNIHTLTLIFFFVVFLSLFKAAYTMYLRSENTKVLAENAKKELHFIENRSSFISKNVKDIETKRGVEYQIRDKYAVAREGEGIIVIVDSTKKNVQDTKESPNWWDKIIELFTL